MSVVVDETHDPARSSWVDGADGHADFPIQNLPLGSFSTVGSAPRGGIAIGAWILDLAALHRTGLLDGEAGRAADAASAETLNPLFALGAGPRIALRRRISALLSDPGRRDAIAPLLHPAAHCTMHLPARIGDYTDFYVGIHHATNVGHLFRPDGPLLPNYKHVPIGYHGRASSIRVSPHPVVRPRGQIKRLDVEAPELAPSARLDYEMELGVWIGTGNSLGAPIPIAEAGSHVAGLSLLNDWSARDIQAWEYQPLGPFLSKSFMSTVSPWIVTSEAIAPFRMAQPPRPAGDPRPLDYLMDQDDQAHGALALSLEVSLGSAAMREQGADPIVLSRSAAANMYWTIAQMIAHHTINGCNLNGGDLLGTGTISSADRDGLGSLIELSRGGSDPLRLPTGEERRFLEDGDVVTLSGRFHAEGRIGIGFGPCTGEIVPARSS